MDAVTEIRPGTVRERELALVEKALTRSKARPRHIAQLIDADGAAVDVPGELVELLRTVVHHLQSGHGVSVAAVHAELTTTEAAELLNVSRPHLIKQLEAGGLPFRLVGSHRRIRLLDVLAYRDQQDVRARAALDRMVEIAEDARMYERTASPKRTR